VAIAHGTAIFEKISQQFLSPGQGADSGHLARIGFCVNPLKLSRLRSGNSAFPFPQEIICEQTAAHPDASMDKPYRRFDARLF